VCVPAEYADQPSLPAVCDVYEKGISLAGMSKVYALPGLRVGWLVSPRANGFIDSAAALKDYTTICGSAPSEVRRGTLPRRPTALCTACSRARTTHATAYIDTPACSLVPHACTHGTFAVECPSTLHVAVAQVLALMALRQRDALLARSKRIVADGLAAVTAFFARHPQLAHFHPPQAGPICYPCFRGDGLSAADVRAYVEELVAETGVLLLPGSACYDVPERPGESAADGHAHFRVGLGRLDCPTNLEVYEKALEDARFQRCVRRGV
jgi:aspartate/methionine/tyrosine aminotransferase